MPFHQSYGVVGLTLWLTIIASVQSSIQTVSTAMEEKYSQHIPSVHGAADLDEETGKVMSLPHHDADDDTDDFRRHKLAKRYALNDTQWRIYSLTYKIFSYPKGLNKADVHTEISRAFAMWSEHTDLTFTLTSSNYSHIKIEFLKHESSDDTLFLSNTLAEAYFYKYGNDVNFGTIKKWSINSTKGVDLFQAAVHIFGHRLGLMHSNVQTAVMAAIYRRYNPNFKLDPDDIAGIQALYGKKNTIRPLLAKKSNNKNVSVCEDLKIDAMFRTANKKFYAFKNDICYKLDIGSVAKGYPKLISVEWPGLEANIDAAFAIKNKAYFFKDTRYWRYNKDHQMEKGYPRQIRHGFPGIPDYLDAAAVCGSGPKVCFFKDRKLLSFYRSNRRPVVSEHDISNTDGQLAKIDAAAEADNGSMHFFKNNKHHTVYFKSLTVDVSLYSGLDNIGKAFGCKNSSSVSDYDGYDDYDDYDDYEDY